jgi:ElaB/YqjD/DUF883 family membrane-anchored ribosome-binding protein
MHFPLATATMGNRAGRAQERSGAPLEELFDGIDDLIKRVADTESPEIRKIRAKVHAAMVAARSAFDERGVAGRRSAPSPDDDLGEYPDQALGIALLVGVGLGVIMSTQS